MPFTPVVLAPLVGLTVDRLGGKLYVLLAAGLVTLLSYFILEVRSCVYIYMCVCVFAQHFVRCWRNLWLHFTPVLYIDPLYSIPLSPHL